MGKRSSLGFGGTVAAVVGAAWIGVACDAITGVGGPDGNPGAASGTTCPCGAAAPPPASAGAPSLSAAPSSSPTSASFGATSGANLTDTELPASFQPDP